ncbi:SsgA family sporulation/cell division regulator [Streptomyces sp. NPDC088925]|uniref:SsgA family sporulation/cell division regulator n=1 Tax=Streptomyces sp. NPDC088925 TaxID=3365914 RepID=UPI0038204020
MAHSVVERELELQLLVSPERTVAVPARLTYRTDDPYAVHILFHLNSESPVAWTFSRELLIEGVFRPSGHGDVRVWPAKEDGRETVRVALTSPDGEALVQVPALPMTAWLERTLRLVPPGTEGELLGMEEGLEHLLAPMPVEELWQRDRDPWREEGFESE